MGGFESYGDIAGMEETLEQIAEGMTGLSVISNTWSSLLGIATYVFMALGMYAIAKRRGIRYPWMGWIPFGNVWMLGCISDQYRYVTSGQEKSKRKIMLGLQIAMYAVMIVAIVLLVVSLIQMFSRMDGYRGEDSGYYSEVLVPLMIGVVLSMVMLGVSIALTVLQYMALHDLFQSCNPAASAVFLVLSIVLSLFGFGVVQAIFVFVCRDKDLGMPVRQTPVMYTQPTWQPPQPPVEPWEHKEEPWNHNGDF